MGLAFLGIKGVEWYQKYEEHHVPGRTFNADDLVRDYPQIHIDPRPEQIYFSLYFAMTGLHALHMIIGVGIFIFLTYHAWKGRYSPKYYTPIEIGGPVLALRRYRLDLSFPAAVFDRPKAAKVSRHV